MRRFRVLVTSNLFDDEAAAILKAADCEVVVDRYTPARTEDQLIDVLQGVHGVIASVDPFTPAVLAEAKDLKVIARSGVGYDAVDVPAATRHGIAVCIARGSNHNAVADYAFALLMACARKVVQNDAEMRKGGFRRFPGPDVWGKTLGIVGLGLIGKGLAQRARGFSMTVLASDIAFDHDFAARHQVRYTSLDELLESSDFVTLHCNLTEKTRGLMNEFAFKRMKPSAYLINTCRGPVVDEPALIRALQEGEIAGAGLDVFEREPPGDTPLLKMENVVLAAHVAGVSDESIVAMGRMSAENVVDVLQGKAPPPERVVNPEVLT